MKWTVIYTLVALGSFWSYFTLKDKLAHYGVSSFIVSNLTLNLILMTTVWGASIPYLLRKRPATIRWGLTLGGFLLILIILTVTGTQTRLTGLMK